MVKVFGSGQMHGPSMQFLYCVQGPNDNTHDMRLSAVIDENICWDEQHVREFCEEENANIILGIPLHNFADKIVWNFEKYGYYTVKSGYYVARAWIKSQQVVHGNGASTSNSLS